MSLPLIVWDLDGTLIDSRQIIQNAMKTAFETCGLEPPHYDRTRTIVGLSLNEGCRMLAPEDASDVVIGDLVEAYKQAFIKGRTQPDYEEPLYEGGIDLLETLANMNCLQAVATGKSRKGIEAVFGMHRLEHYFDTVWCADDGPGKPHPFMVEQAMSQLGVEASQTLMIGDAIHDIHMGRAAGVVTHGVTWGFGARHELEAAGAHHLHDEMETLAASLTEFARVTA